MHSLSCFDAQVSKECAWLKISTQIVTSDTDTDLSTFSWLSVQKVNSVSASCHFVASATQEKCIIACFLIVRNRIQAGNLLNKQQCSRQSELIQHPVSLTRTWERHSTACHRMACVFILERTAWLLEKKCSRRLAKNYDGKWQRKQRTPEELEIRKRNIEQILKRRRNGICSEVERSWFIQGAYLEKHRHNLKVTQDLISGGFLYPWCWSVYLLHLFAVLFRHVFYCLKKFFTKKLKF